MGLVDLTCSGGASQTPGEEGKMASVPKPYTQPLTPPEFAQTSVPQPRQLTPLQRVTSRNPGCCPRRGEFHPRMIASVMQLKGLRAVDVGGGSLSSLSRGTNPSLSLNNSSPLWLPSTGAQGE